ncbi:MAG: hypothetical protein PHP93_03405 [Kiritimatiellales bacterium]|nr:hypothetical protein [Kiritimatiellales bacterium]
MMDWLPKMMDWLPRLILALAAVTVAAGFLRLKITWKREGSVEFLGFKWPWSRRSEDRGQKTDGDNP